MKTQRVRQLGLGLGILLQILALSSASANRGRHHNSDTYRDPSSDQTPECADRDGNDLGIDNSQVIDWKTSTPNNYLNRAHVSGTVTKVYPDQTDHAHFEIDLGNSDTTLEVIYDLRFGSIPDVQVGDSIEACGDYITAYAQSGHYAPSPDGAIIHWIHKSDNPDRHPDGFLMINGTLYGQELPNN